MRRKSGRLSMSASSRSLGVALASVVLAGSIVGCSLLKKKAPDEDTDPAAGVADAATVTVSGIGAKNEGTVLRYANEVPLPNEPAVIGKDGAKARNFPGNGPEVAVLPKGTPVAKIAQYFSTGTLIMFDDPSGDGSKLIGWVSPKSFDVTAPAPTKLVIVPPRVDAGSPTVKDAGVTTQDSGAPTPVKDAGAAPVADAGGGGSPSTSKLPAIAPIDGKCTPDRVLTEGMCRFKCVNDTSCPRGTKCVSKGALKVCSAG